MGQKIKLNPELSKSSSALDESGTCLEWDSMVDVPGGIEDN